MVLSRDWQEVSVLECILGGLQIGVDIESHPERAWAKLSKSKVDALIVDCDLKGADSFLRQLQENSDHGSALPVVIVSGSRGQHHLGEKGAVFEAVHGSAPDIAGLGIANPTALLQSAILMLTHIEERQAAEKIENAMLKVFAEGKVRTRDIGGSATTNEFADAIIETMNN